MRNSIGWWVANVMAPSVNGFPAYRGWRPCIEWCEEQFGDQEMDRWQFRWLFEGDGIFKFRSEQDYLLFLLRWA